MKLFVYGALRRGGANHGWIADSACVSQQAWISAELREMGTGGPICVRGENGEVESGSVYGELYDVDPDRFTGLDREVASLLSPVSVRREEAAVATDKGETKAWVYAAAKEEVPDGDSAASGDWRIHRLKEEFAKAEDGKLLYFAYGSCMDNERLAQDGVEQLFLDAAGRGVLDGYSLRFTRRAADGGRADIVECGGQVEGKLYRVTEDAVDYLWQREGVNASVYRPAFVPVRRPGDGPAKEALTFVVVRKEEETEPPAWYRDEILRGAADVVSEAYYGRLKERLCPSFG